MNIFDIIGPVMIGPSSSHTAGAVRIGRVSWKILGEDVIQADIGLAGSFALACKGHGTDKALIAGILGMKVDDDRIPHSFEIAADLGLSYQFSEISIPHTHPNTAVLHLRGIRGTECTVQGVSIGGGNVIISKINGMDAVFSGAQDTLIIAHHDTPGVIASVTSQLAKSGANIGNFRLSRPQKGKLAIMTIEMDSGIEKSTVNELRALPDITSVIYMQESYHAGV